MYKVLILVIALAACTLGGKTIQKKHIVRPCHPITDHCVGENMEANSQCSTKRLSSVPSSYFYGSLTYETPYFNATTFQPDLKIQNLDKCFISEFFFNLKTDVAVLSVDCPGLVLSSNRTLIQHCSKQEDTTYSYANIGVYPLIRLTVNIKNANAMNICKSSVYTDVTQLPKFVNTPKDKPTRKFLSQDLSYLNIYEREMFFYLGPVILHKYINTRVCNFGCHA